MKEVLISKLDHEGRGIAYANNKITFVENTLPDEIVDFNIVKEKRQCNIAKVSKYQRLSPKRQIPVCSSFGVCGGCDLLHMSYLDTIKFKCQKTTEILNKYAKLKPKINIIDNTNPLHYRNKISLKIVNGKIGFYQKESHELIEITECFITKESINKFIPDIPLLNVKNGEITIRSNYNDELLIIITTPKRIKIELDQLRTKHKIVGVIQNKRLTFGKNFFIEKAGNYFFQVSYDSFFQINEYINNQVLKLISNLDFSHKKVLDLYCGVGQLGIATSKSADGIYGIELVENAIKDAVVNARMNKLKKTYFLNANASKALNALQIKDFEYIIIDPPRGGLNKDTMFHIEDILPNNIIYMSCDAMTLARDLNWLKKKYSLKKFYLLDMFSFTHHIETISLLSRRKSK